MQSAREIVDQAGGLATARGLAEILGISRQRIYDYARKPGFPEPVRIVGGTPVWGVTEVVRWFDAYRANPPRPGRKPKPRKLPKGVVV